MPTLGGLLAMTQLNAPPATVPDARLAVAVYCRTTCPAEAVEALDKRLGRRFEKAWRLPAREARAARYTLNVVPAAALEPYDPVTLDTYSSALSAEQRAALYASQEVLLVAAAIPRRAEPLDRQRSLNAAVLDFARAADGLIEDVYTREVYPQEAWDAFRVQSLEPPVALYEQVTLLWSDDRSRAVTLGLRKFGLHELVVDGVTPATEDDAAVLVVAVAAQAWQTPVLDRRMSLAVDQVRNDTTRQWLQAWQVFADDPGAVKAGTGRAELDLRNAIPRRGDPDTPALEIGFRGAYGDPEVLGRLMDQLWGWADPETVGAVEPSQSAPGEAPAEAPVEAPAEAPLAVPVDGWSTTAPTEDGERKPGATMGGEKRR